MWRRFIGYRAAVLRRRGWSVSAITRYFCTDREKVLAALERERSKSRIAKLFGIHPTITDAEAIELAESGHGGP